MVLDISGQTQSALRHRETHGDQAVYGEGHADPDGRVRGGEIQEFLELAASWMHFLEEFQVLLHVWKAVEVNESFSVVMCYVLKTQTFLEVVSFVSNFLKANQLGTNKSD